ncbi:hypothetical protein [Arthrobacter roseus]|uniref:hypothetical protein n=1 Tax=Arthrobacter roseus TaxID=136274 RepID=UPI001964687C|nr:hypothetical protein [Arthrobacter roseus]MBM7847503.1 hypothetical protein [Arthrobacter roseus]
MSSQQHDETLDPVNPCTCPDRAKNGLWRHRYIEHPSIPVVDDPECKRCFPGHRTLRHDVMECALIFLGFTVLFAVFGLVYLS